jgi:hypothetical protein
LLADETAPPLQFLCPFIHAASGRGILDELVKILRSLRIGVDFFYAFSPQQKLGAEEDND